MKLICKICGKEFENRSSHLRLCHNMSNNEYFDKYIEPNDDHKCPYCENKRKWKAGKYCSTCGSKKCKYKCMIESHKKCNPLELHFC